MSQTVAKAASSTALTSSQPTSTFGQQVTFTATVSSSGGTPTGTVTFTDGGNSIGTGSVGTNGQATFATSALAVGSHSITASYGGDANFDNSTNSNTVSHTVTQATSATALSASPSTSTAFGTQVTFTATVSAVAPASGTPTGTVTFTIDGTAGAPVNLVNGMATTATSSLSVAGSPHSISATYNDDGTFSGSTSAKLTQTVTQATSATALSASPSTSTAFGTQVTFAATVSAVAPASGTPTGTVTFFDGSTQIGTGKLSGGMATFQTSVLAGGSHIIKASYSGDRNFGTSSNTLSQNVIVSTTITLTSSPNPSQPNQAVTFTATVSGAGGGTPNGSVTFSDGGTTLGNSTLNSSGVATYMTSTLTLGSHSITAVFSGNANFAKSTSAVLVQNVSKTTDSAKLHQITARHHADHHAKLGAIGHGRNE